MQAIQITDGRTSLWQWDTGVSIKVYGCTDVDQMHFVTPGGIISRDLVDGECGVPDTALQTEGLLKMYAFDRTENGGVTRCDFLLMVKARPKPADYIDPPDEYDNLEELAKRVAPLIPGGGGEPVTPEQIKQAVDNYLTENPVEVEETDPTVPGWAKAKQKPTYTAEEVGAQPKGDYALKSDIPAVPVKSVNGKTGTVVLNASDVGALPADAEIVDTIARDGVATLSEEKLDKTYFDAEAIPFTIKGYAKYKDGSVTENTSARCTDYIDIVDAKELQYNARIAESGATVAFYDAEKNYLQELSIAGNGEWQNGIIDLTIQLYEAAAFARVSMYNYTSATYCRLYRGYNIERVVNELDSLKEKSDNIESAMLEKVTPEDTTFFDSNEHFDKSQAEVVRNRFADSEGYVGSSSSAVSVVFPVAPSTEYVLQINPEKTSRNRNIIVGGTTKEFPKDYYPILNAGIAAQNNALGFTTEADTTWAFAYIESGSTEYSLDDFSLQANGIPVDMPPTLKREYLPSDISYNTFSSKPDGIDVLIFGDSITSCMHIVVDTTTNLTTEYWARPNKDNGYTDANGNSKRFYMWPTLFQQLVKCREMRDYACSGASYKDRTRDEGNELQNVSYQIEVALNDLYNPNNAFKVDDFNPDIVIFALGTNDGPPGDTFDSAMEKTVLKEDGVSIDVDATLAALDRTKFCEAARYAMLKVRKAFPYAMGMCVLPIQRADSEFTSSNIRDALRDVANRCGYITLDGYGETGIIRDLETANGLGACLKDGLHPNDAGQKLYARMIVQAIRRYFMPLTEFTD